MSWVHIPKKLIYFVLCLQINLRLILVSGKTKEFVFNPVDSAGDIAIHVYDNWPEGRYLHLCNCSFHYDTEGGV